MSDEAVIAILILLVMQNNEQVPPPRVAQWASSLAAGCLAKGIPLAFALKWIEMESGGNPCAVGDLSAFGDDGNPREMGIVQLFNPDDVKRYGLTGAELRAYCVPGTQELSRPLTPAERQRQADAAVAMIAHSMATATADLASVGAAWPVRDYWALVKLQHGLPGLSSRGLPAVAMALGRAPLGWDEFKMSLAAVTLDRETMRYRAKFAKIISNAERCAAVLS